MGAQGITTDRPALREQEDTAPLPVTPANLPAVPGEAPAPGNRPEDG